MITTSYAYVATYNNGSWSSLVDITDNIRKNTKQDSTFWVDAFGTDNEWYQINKKLSLLGFDRVYSLDWGRDILKAISYHNHKQQ